MKRKQKSVLMFGSIFTGLAVAACLYLWWDTRHTIEDEAPPLASFDSSNLYVIEPEKFVVSTDGTNARATTDGINNALEWAKQNGYRGVSLPDGTYLIKCSWGNPFTLPDDGIFVPSDTVLDLGRAVLMIEPNSQPAYNLIYTMKGSNIIINGGRLVGDRDSHTYGGGDFATHEWGCGINIVASTGVTVQNMTIEKMTGDAITVRGGSRINSKDVTVANNTLSGCRRQGISITGCDGGTVSGNVIYNIKGTPPEYGIDLEANSGYDARNLKITGNTISNCKGGSILCYNGSGNTVSGNTCINGNIVVGGRASDLDISRNTMKNSILGVKKGAVSIETENNIMEGSSRMIRE